jgi:hypothetical protein
MKLYKTADSIIIEADFPFTLKSGDEIFIAIDSIGTLKNIVA